MTEKLKHMKETLMCCVEKQLDHLDTVDAKELGEVVDMIKDLEEAIYYATITEAMKGKEEYSKSKGYEHQAYYSEPYYRDMDRYSGRMYYGDSRMMYNGNGSSSSGSSMSGGHSSTNGSYSGNSSSNGSSSSAQYSEREYPLEMRDYREGRSPKSRRMYMESKQTHQDKIAQMRELERYVQELTQDIVEMVEDASPEEKQYLSKRVTALGNKLSQLND